VWWEDMGRQGIFFFGEDADFGRFFGFFWILFPP
jgi:hypothetical protein